ncbi:hypothetical protein A2U01_0111535, partial [Trifolium medium]|nr:hypothetical protein [Trifolium medium]
FLHNPADTGALRSLTGALRSCFCLSCVAQAFLRVAQRSADLKSKI